MKPLRTILRFLLVTVAVLAVGCGGATVSQPTTYTPEQVADIQIYTPRVVDVRDRFPELEGYIQNKEWVDIGSFIHGPLGELRVNLKRVATRLLPQDKQRAQELIDDLALRLEQLDVAATNYNQFEAGNQYRKALDDFDAFLSLIPDEAA